MLRSLAYAALGTLFTFLMTALGAATVFFFAHAACERTQRALLGFAAGVMTAASIWSLLLPAIEQAAEEGRFPACCWERFSLWGWTRSARCWARSERMLMRAATFC